jgi:hypothetical protein
VSEAPWGIPTLHKWTCSGCPATCMTDVPQLVELARKVALHSNDSWLAREADALYKQITGKDAELKR